MKVESPLKWSMRWKYPTVDFTISNYNNIPVPYILYVHYNAYINVYLLPILILYNIRITNIGLSMKR